MKEVPGCDGVVLGGHGLFTWGNTQRESYLNTITIIDQIGQFIESHRVARKSAIRSAAQGISRTRNGRRSPSNLMPFLRGSVSSQQRMIGSFTGYPEVLDFVNSHSAAKLGVSWAPAARITSSGPRSGRCLWTGTRQNDAGRFSQLRTTTRWRNIAANMPTTTRSMRCRKTRPRCAHANPTVVLVPGIGMFSFGKNKAEARITGEFYVNAIHVMEGAGHLDEGNCPPNPAASRTGGGYQRLQGPLQLRCAAAFRSLSHRVLGPGRSQDTQAAGGEGIERPHRAGGRRSQRDWPRSGAAWPRNAARMWWSRTASWTRANKVAAEAQAIAGREAAIAAKIDIRDRARDSSSARCDHCRPLAASTSWSIRLRFSLLARRRHQRRSVGIDARDQRHRQLPAGG